MDLMYYFTHHAVTQLAQARPHNVLHFLVYVSPSSSEKIDPHADQKQEINFVRTLAALALVYSHVAYYP